MNLKLKQLANFAAWPVSSFIRHSAFMT
jgi:hypothetical protein